MPRELVLPTRELGELRLFLVYSRAGIWEESWRVAQGLSIAESFTVTTKAIMDHALRGWTLPLVKALGIPPVGAIKKLPAVSQQCEIRTRCPMYHRAECTPSHKAMPWCFQPGGLASDEERRLVADTIQKWRAGVYLVVVDEP
jgi:hypothetical protein